MEIFLIISVLILIVACLCLNLFHFVKVHVELKAQRDLQSRIIEVLSDLNADEKENYQNHFDKIDEVATTLNRSLLALKESFEAKPIKPNNWDSFREAFKGPVRVEINERN